MWALEFSMLKRYISNIKSVTTHHQLIIICLYIFVLFMRCIWFACGILTIFYLRFDILFLICNIYCALSFVIGMMAFGYASDVNNGSRNPVTISVAIIWLIWYLICMIIVYIDVYYISPFNIALSITYFVIEYILIIISATYFLILMLKFCVKIYFARPSEVTICINSDNEMYTENNILVSSKYNDDDICAICLCQYVNSDKILILKCGHRYHSTCCSKWFKIKRECPICRQTLIINI
jgi:hypothetical protein